MKGAEAFPGDRQDPVGSPRWPSLPWLKRIGTVLEGELLEQLLAAAVTGLSHYVRQGGLERPASNRLGFRELGLAIGLQAAERMYQEIEEERESPRASRGERERLEAALSHTFLRAAIESFWLEPAHRRAQTWTEHRDINEVMLATSLAPDGCLLLPPID